LVAMGVNPRTALATIRFSMGHGTTVTDIDRAAEAVAKVAKLQNPQAA